MGGSSTAAGVAVERTKVELRGWEGANISLCLVYNMCHVKGNFSNPRQVKIKAFVLEGGNCFQAHPSFYFLLNCGKKWLLPLFPLSKEKQGRSFPSETV